ncbi:MAG: transcriptional regulator, IclR family [Solirubrobacterales bacterium]|jgi:DNA-binding IclR family transcriptional regulator|nr:transcriptional regulator, IclR family [Solirubrobacterales bacterium]
MECGSAEDRILLAARGCRPDNGDAEMLLTVLSVGRILDLYDCEQTEHGPTEAAARLSVSKSKAHLLMTSMAEIGLLRRTPGGRYCVGWRALSLERLVTGNAPFRPVARAMAVRLARHCGEMIHVAALDAGRVVYVDRIPGTRAIEIPMSSVGAMLPAHCSGVGKLLLAHLDPGQIDAILDRHGMGRLTEATICDREALYAELHRIRRDGVSCDREEVQLGLSCAAAPIVDADGQVVAAMSISAPTSRFRHSESAYRRTIVGAADGVSRQLRTSALTEERRVS